MPERRERKPKPVRVVFLGGLGEIGRNCACIEVEGRIVVLDCGIMFPDPDMPGIDLVLLQAELPRAPGMDRAEANMRAVEEIAACVTEDFEWRLTAGGSPSGAVLRGKDALRAYFGDKSKAHREARYSEARIHRSGDKLFGTFRVTGIDHAGKPFDRYGIDLYELRDGKIALKDSYLKAD